MTYSDEFERWYAYLQSVEGGVVDHALDSGGATWYGISSGFLETIGRTGPVSREDAKKIAHDYFWEAIGADDMAPVAAWCFADAYFNHRPDTAGRLLQYGLGVAEDGIVGPATRAAAAPGTLNAKLFWERYAHRRTGYYVGLVKSDPEQLVFLGGWVNRIRRLGQSMLAAGLAEPELRKLPWYAPVTDAVTSPAAKATGLAAVAGFVVGALQYVGVTPESGREWLQGIGAPAGLASVAVAWIARLNLNRN